MTCRRKDFEKLLLHSTRSKAWGNQPAEVRYLEGGKQETAGTAAGSIQRSLSGGGTTWKRLT